MKKINYIIAIASLAVTTMFSSCLKDPRYVNFASSPNLIEIPIVANLGEFQTASYAISTTPSQLSILINLASTKLLSSPVVVKFKIDQAALDAYNTANGTTYTLLPAADYSSNLSVTIPAGQREANLNISVNSSLIDLTQSYVLPITISDPGAGNTVSGNYGTVLYKIGAKNQYDGQYTVTGTMTDVVNPAIIGNYPIDYYLETESATSDALYDFAFAGAFGHEISSSGSTSYYGSFSPVFTFDANNNITSITNYYGQFSGGSVRSAVLDPTGVNKYTTGTPGAAGSVFQVSYYMDQGNPGVPRTHFVETYTYKGVRP